MPTVSCLAKPFRLTRALVWLAVAAAPSLLLSAEYDVRIVRTSYGIPHITAADYGSLGYGEGYAAAQDHVCNIADAIITAKGEQARFFGPGENDSNVVGDIVHRSLGIIEKSPQLFAGLPPHFQDWLEGYAAGVNRYIREERITSWCRGSDFVEEITATDLLCRLLTATQTLPRVAAMIAAAQPPTAQAAAVDSIQVAPELLADANRNLLANPLGSNGWAIGRERTENGRGMLLGNPHFPWNGTNRFWEKHLVIPGELDVYGAGLIGIPGVTIGFNENVAWTHTVSDSKRLVPFKLTLVPGDPTSYLFDGQPRKLEARTVTVPIRDGDGQTISKEHTVWYSHHGPVVVMPGFTWNHRNAYALNEANQENLYALSQWMDMAVAKDMDEFIDAHRTWNAMPWVNTIAASADGRAVYLDNSTVRNFSDEAIELWHQNMKSDFMTKVVYGRSKMVLADGSDKRWDFVSDPTTKIDGVVPFDKRPLLDRTDFVFNSNDSYWLTNPASPLTGYSPLYGPVGTPRSIRTRVNAIMLSDTSAAGHAGDDGKFSLQEMQQALFSNRSLAAELLREQLVEACKGVKTVELEDGQVEITKAVQVIAGYNGRVDIDSPGAVLFREWLTSYDYSETADQGKLFAVPFDPQDPINTPRDLSDRELAVQNLAKAVQALQRAGLPLDCTLGDAQIAHRSGTGIAVHGGHSYEGVANLMQFGSGDWRGFDLDATKIKGSRFLTDKGYPVVHGTSFLLSVSFTDDGPRAEAVLSYSQSGDPSSEHYTDQTRLFAKEQLRPALFRPAEIKANTISAVTLTGAR